MSLRYTLRVPLEIHGLCIRIQSEGAKSNFRSAVTFPEVVLSKESKLQTQSAVSTETNAEQSRAREIRVCAMTGPRQNAVLHLCKSLQRLHDDK